MTLRDAWEAEAANWITWERTPGHDSYWKFHREAFLPTLPPAPRRVVDVGCGEGRVVRDMKALGYDVTGMDASETLILAARLADPGGRYVVADAASLPLPDASTDLVTAHMSMHDIDDLDSALREVARILVPGGHLRMAIVHPINSAGSFVSTDDDAAFEITDSYFEDRRYVDTLERSGLRMTFTSQHRPLERMAQAILETGMLIDRIAEIPDTASTPGSRWRRLPMFLHLGAVKPPPTTRVPSGS